MSDKYDDGKDNEKNESKNEYEEYNKQHREELRKKIRETNPNYDSPENVIPLKKYPQREGLKTVEYKELIITKTLPIEYVLHPILSTQGIAFIYAATGIGKTLFALNIGYIIAQGGNFLKYSCPKPRKVLYIDGEMAFNELFSRFQDIYKSHGKLHFEDNFHILTPDKIFPYSIPKIDEQIGQELYIDLIDRLKIEVIIFDNLSMLSSFDENKANEWSIIQQFLLSLRQKGKTVIVIHHAGKDKNGYRGTSKMLDGANVAISLQEVNEDKLEEDNFQGKKIKVSYQKTRGFWGKDALPFEANLHNSIWSYKSYEQTEMELVLDKLDAKLTQRDISKETGLSLSKVNRLIGKAKMLGKIT